MQYLFSYMVFLILSLLFVKTNIRFAYAMANPK